MSKFLMMWMIFFVVPSAIAKPTPLDKKLTAANTFLNSKDYPNAFKLFAELHKQIKPGDKLFSEVNIGYATAVYYTLPEAKIKYD